ncbi:E3 ubiquitin-protein ligase RGLG2 [Trifolium repens]|nr:E3 ubiquitin-protein ligase RGLG2 [Trifolium repens]
MLVTMDEMWEKGRESGSAKARKMEGLQGLNLFPMRITRGDAMAKMYMGFWRFQYCERCKAHKYYIPRHRSWEENSTGDDNYNSLEQVTEALASSGLESSNFIVGIDFTKSNEWTCFVQARSFQRRCLHHIGHEQNPYEQAISIIGKTLPSFDEDNLIPVLDSEMRQHMTKKFLVSMMMRDFVMDSKKC